MAAGGNYWKGNPMRYVVSCMPRSGSTWLANFLTDNENTCYHDLSVRAYKEMKSIIPLGHSLGLEGISDTGVSIADLKGEEITVLTVVRSTTDVANSLFSVLKDPPLSARMAVHSRHRQDVISKHYNIEHIHFNDLFKLETLKYIWDVCKDVPFPAARAEMLIGCKIEPTLTRLIEESTDL